MPTYSITNLDANQVIRSVFDEENGRLRTDAIVSTEMGGDVEVAIDSVDDSITLGDDLGNHVTTTDAGSGIRALDVNVTSPISATVSPQGLNGPIDTGTITIGDTVTKVTPFPISDRASLSVRVWGSETVYFGRNDVTTMDGYPKFQYEEIIIDLKESTELWAICESGKTCEIRYFEVSEP